MGTAFGTAFTWLAGGLVIGMFVAAGGLTLPYFGQFAPWQAVFVAVGLPGLIPALLFVFTVKEPTRKDLAAKEKGKASWGETKDFMRLNRTTLICHHAGIALTIMGIYGWINWMPTFFVRLHGWTPQEFAIPYGIYGAVAGVASAISCGWLANKLKERGWADGTMRACLIGCLGVTILGAAAPLMPTRELALAMFILAGLFANYPSVLALASISEIAPNELRAFITAVYILMVGLISSGLGPLAVGMFTDYVFADKQAVGWSITWVTGGFGLIGCIFLAYGLKSYRESLARVTWGK
jgi:MFS family permease